ncbi:alkaline phosphatase D family protein [Marinobacteraceae bacterium S3BR75-40.1]
MKRLTRRDFLRVSALSVGAVAVSTGLQGCLVTDDPRPVRFDHGVASGDPLQDRVLLWTRITPRESMPNEIPYHVSWEVATDPDFLDLVHSGHTQAKQEHDFTVKVDVLNLVPGRTYYYRFKANGKYSPVGKTRTLPEGMLEQVTLAVFSCANYPAGYFHAYAEAAREDNLDAVVHLGDYLYEYKNGQYATEDAEELGRLLPEDNDVELLTLTDYRKRYALYHRDQDLQALHATAPFIAVWDDHEVANDAWREGAENHNAGEGDYSDRKLAALQAYFEWMPIRPADENDWETVFRSFRFGDLVALHMLDTRIIGRDQQLDYADYFDASGNFNQAQFQADLTDPNRTMLGAEQWGWLQNQMATSSATWQVLGQQVLMGRMTLPAELLQLIQNPDPAQLLPKFAELGELKARYLAGDPTLTPTDIARIETVLPYNLDAWDGYFYERERVLGLARQLNKNLVVLAGDTHNAWANDLKDYAGNQVGVEFATSSVSSPGLEEYLQLPPQSVPQTEQGLALLVDDLQYLNINQRGYLRVTFTPEAARADWRYVTTIKSHDYSLDESRAMALQTRPGAGNRRIEPV